LSIRDGVGLLRCTCCRGTPLMLPRGCTPDACVGTPFAGWHHSLHALRARARRLLRYRQAAIRRREKSVNEAPRIKHIAYTPPSTVATARCAVCAYGAACRLAIHAAAPHLRTRSAHALPRVRTRAYMPARTHKSCCAARRARLLQYARRTRTRANRRNRLHARASGMPRLRMLCRALHDDARTAARAWLRAAQAAMRAIFAGNAALA